MKSLNEIIAELEAFATAHWQIHTFGHGDVWEISPQSDGIVYPILWMVPQTATPSLNEVVDEFTILCMDLVDSGERNETEVLSDTRQIILDVCAFYRQTHTNSYIIEFGGSIEPFTERDPERVSGHSLTVRIKQPHDYNLCAVPANAVPVPAIPSCADATVQNAAINPTYQASVASGGVLVLPQFKVLDTDGATPILANYVPNTTGFAATCSPAADATFSIDGTQVDTVASGADLDVSVELDGNPVTPTYNSGTKVIGVTSTPCPTDLTIRFYVRATHDAFSEVMTANEAGTITSVNNGGLSAFVLSVNATPVTAPFNIVNGDTVSAAFTAAGAATTVILTGTY